MVLCLEENGLYCYWVNELYLPAYSNQNRYDMKKRGEGEEDRLWRRANIAYCRLHGMTSLSVLPLPWYWELACMLSRGPLVIFPSFRLSGCSCIIGALVLVLS